MSILIIIFKMNCIFMIISNGVHFMVSTPAPFLQNWGFKLIIIYSYVCINKRADHYLFPGKYYMGTKKSLKNIYQVYYIGKIFFVIYFTNFIDIF